MVFKRAIEIAETRDFSEFHVPMLPIPERVEAAIAKGVQRNPDLSFASAGRLIEPAGDGMIDGVVRNRDGVLVVCCQTDMPGVSPEMWDWWFGWHGLSSERYRMWHPRDHVWSAMTENRAHLLDARSRYIGNTSLIEERMGGTDVHRLSVAFKPPHEFGLDEAKLATLGTAICARGGDRGKFVESAYLIHFVRRTNAGAQMRSRFWLGHVQSKIPVIGSLISRKMNTAAMRTRVITDEFGLRLLRHCAEEMNHLPRILPELYAQFKDE
jgi:hypothetical protein